MRRFVGSMLVALILGISIGVYLGWEQFPVDTENSFMCQLSEEAKEEYTLMVARAYQADLQGQISQSSDEARNIALSRLLPLRSSNSENCSGDPQIDNIPAWVQEVTERYRTEGANLEEICVLASLSAGFGRQIPGYADRPGTVCDQFLQ
ncbi:MAG: hypothetical protein F9K27_08210 [Anaerolineae bacterium]|jgi:hypothetical protein|nr:MAG: hypothetical protein F9K27_08210 [Anaerolineae bacterium]